MPWGISEAAYNVRDLQLNYQYGPFGVPGLGLKRGLIEDLVVSPYATLLAAEINPRAAMENLRRLREEGALARLDSMKRSTTPPNDCRRDRSFVLIRAFMTHHQGMSLIALTISFRTIAWKDVFMPTRWSRRPNCCCRSASRSASRLRIRERKKF